jgi:3'(2'), 5'-bisphosphate nucleotidase
MTAENTDLFTVAEAMVPFLRSIGASLLEVYSRDFTVELKDDRTPITEADRKAHDIIAGGLRSFPVDGYTDLPLLSEEGRDIPFDERSSWSRFWMIDPLDGTKEFVKRNGEFTVNIALIEEGFPVLGFVYVPLTSALYFGRVGTGAYRTAPPRSDTPEASELTVECIHRAVPLPEISGGRKGPGMPETTSPDKLKIVASRSHMNDETEGFIGNLERRFGKPVALTSAGSSIKLCRIAEGTADVYPRFAPTMEWDTAAADAVCRAAGCYVIDRESGKDLVYNKRDLRNPHFLAARDPRFRELLL